MRRVLQFLLSIMTRYVRALLLHPADLGVIAVVEQEGKVVLVRHSYKSGWMFPGGAVDRHESPEKAVIRELKEEIGLIDSQPPELIGIYLRPGIWADNYVILYRVRDARFAFSPSWEIRELMLTDPAAPPPGSSAATQRRLQEIYAAVPRAEHW